MLGELGHDVVAPVQDLVDDPVSVGERGRGIALKVEEKGAELVGGHGGGGAGVVEEGFLDVGGGLVLGHLEPSDEAETDPVISHGVEIERDGKKGLIWIWNWNWICLENGFIQ